VRAASYGDKTYRISLLQFGQAGSSPNPVYEAVPMDPDVAFKKTLAQEFGRHYAFRYLGGLPSGGRFVVESYGVRLSERMTATAYARRSTALVAVDCVVSLTGCGGSSRKTPSASARSQSTPAFSACMRAHGVTNFPDPGLHLSGSFNSIAGIEFPSTINPSSPAFEAAQTACAKLLPRGGPPAQASERQRAQLFATSKCMRAHGVSGFPDPVISSTPPTPPAGGGMVSGIGDLYLVVPSTIGLNSAAFKQAAEACHLS
jgi:hypothetical protein